MLRTEKPTLATIGNHLSNQPEPLCKTKAQKSDTKKRKSKALSNQEKLQDWGLVPDVRA